MSYFNVQIPDSSYKKLQVLAGQDGISVDQFIATAVAQKIAALTTESYLEALAKRGSREKYDAVLAKVSDSEPSFMTSYRQANHFSRRVLIAAQCNR